MDFLNKSYGQVTDLFRSMTPGSRITAGLLLIVITTSLVYLFVFQAQSGTDYLFGAREFSQTELDAMQKAFGTAGLDQFEVVGFRIRVPRRKRYQYIQALSQENFTPENFDSAVDEVLSSSSSWFESSQLRSMKIQHATQKKLARVISAITGIERATVQYHEERKGGYPVETIRKATIAVAASGRRPLDAALVRAVRATTSGWFGIDPENVVVTDLVRGRAYGGKNDIDDRGAADTVYADTKHMFEKAWQETILDRLSMYPGIVAAVNVQLDPEMDNVTSKVTYDPQATAIESNTSQKTRETKSPAGGRPGAVTNEVPSNQPREILASSSPIVSSDESTEKQVSVAGHEQTRSKKASLIPQQVTVSVGVPKSYYRTVWKQRNPPKADQAPVEPDQTALKGIEQDVKKDIEVAIVSLLPSLSAGTNPYPQVTVTSYDDLPPEPIVEPSMAETGLAWLSENWQTLALFGIGLISLMMVRGMIRSAAADAPPTPAVLPLPEHPANETTEEEPHTEETMVLNRRAKSTGSTLREELTILVKEDPDAAANVLRTWIGDIA